MTAVNPTSSSILSELGAPAAAGAAGDRNALGQEDFLELLLTQLKHQDPLSPMENGEFMGQLAQFGAVSSMQAVERSVAELATSLQSAQALQATSLVGRSVLVADSSALLEPGGGIAGRIQVPAGAGPVAVRVLDATGQVVQTINLGSHAAGSLAFHWDGTGADGKAAAAGAYRLQASASIDGRAVGLEVATAARVQSVSLGRSGEGITVNLAGAGSRSLDQVLEIL